jgi:adenylate kinase family enzyme
MLHKKIIILGPPCVGKTTLSHTALKHKIPSFSTHGTTRQNREEVFTYIINLNISLFLDSGGLDIGWINGEIDDRVKAKTVLLLPPKDVYLERERIKIEKNESRNQGGLNHYNNFTELKSEFDLVIEDVLSPQEILDYIIETFGFEK